MEPQTIEEVPLFSESLKITKFLGYLLKNTWRRYVSLILCVIITTAEAMEVRNRTIDDKIRITNLVVYGLTNFTRAISICYHRFVYEDCMEYVRQLYVELLHSEDKLIDRMLENTMRRFRFMSLGYLIFTGSCCIGYIINPMLMPTRTFPYEMYVPIVDKFESPYYEMVFGFEVLYSFLVCYMYLPFTNIVIGTVLFATLMCQVLQYKLRKLPEIESARIRQEVVWCIQYHLKMIKLVDTINDLTSNIFFLEFLTFSTMLCQLLFLIVVLETISAKLTLASFVVWFFCQLALIYYTADKLYDESLAVATAAYSSGWSEFDVPTQRLIKLIMARAQKPSAIFVGRIYPMNLELLQSLMNATYTYFMLLKRVYG